jgi:hypothetical protein
MAEIPQRTKKEKSMARRLFDFMSSFALAGSIFFFMLLITLCGTLEQENKGIHEVQEKYFASFGVIHDLGGIPIPLPGGYLLMAVLFVNLLLGGIIRIRKDWRRAPMVVTHFSILVLLAGAWVTHHYADDGAMRVFEKDKANYFSSFVIWDMVIERWENGTAPEKALVLQEEQLMPIKGESRRVFYSGDLPFEVEVRNVMLNSMPAYRRASALDEKAKSRSFDGFYLASKAPEKEGERNIPGAEVRLIDKEGNVMNEGIVWGLAREAFVTDVDGVKWAIRYEKRIFEVPFTIVLDDFEKEEHPGTQMAMRFVSTVRKVENESEEKIVIKMNHPLRHRGYTLFQSGFGPSENDPPGTGVYSVFAVWRNPADKWPLYSCYMVAIGMASHFILKLILFLMRSAKTSRSSTTPTEV